MQTFEKLKNKTILLVEDQAVIRNNIASMLRFFFKEVYTANNGYDGLDTYERHLPDIVMTDLKMPHMGGFELLEEIDKRYSTSYRIVVSAHTDTPLLLEAVNSGVDRYIVKPVTERNLFEAFEAYLAKIEASSPDCFQLTPHILFDADNHTITIKEDTIHLNTKETMFLKLLCEDKEKTYSYDEIENRVWGGKSMSLAALRSVVRDLKKKTGNKLVENVSGAGYRLNLID